MGPSGGKRGVEARGAREGSGGGDAGVGGRRGFEGRGRGRSFVGGGEGAGAHVTGSDRFWRQKGPRRPERDGPGAGGSEAARAASE